jgi:hypothetical protein
MADEQVFFRKTGEETSAYVLVWVFDESGRMTAEASIEAPAADDGQYETLDFKGDVQPVLRDAVEYAALNGFDLRIYNDGVVWPTELGSLVG